MISLAYKLNRIRLQFRIFACAICVFSFHASNLAHAGQSIEAITVWLAQTYDNPSILRQERDAIVVKHTGGIKRIPLSEIPSDLQQASQAIIYAPLDEELVVVFTNASPV
jgi:signal recognition particle subunit SEC65